MPSILRYSAACAINWEVSDKRLLPHACPWDVYLANLKAQLVCSTNQHTVYAMDALPSPASVVVLLLLVHDAYALTCVLMLSCYCMQADFVTAFSLVTATLASDGRCNNTHAVC